MRTQQVWGSDKQQQNGSHCWWLCGPSAEEKDSTLTTVCVTHSFYFGKEIHRAHLMGYSSRHCFCADATIPSWLWNLWQYNVVTEETTCKHDHSTAGFQREQREKGFLWNKKSDVWWGKIFVLCHDVIWTLSFRAHQRFISSWKWTSRSVVLFTRMIHQLYPFVCSHSVQIIEALITRSTLNVPAVFKTEWCQGELGGQTWNDSIHSWNLSVCVIKRSWKQLVECLHETR